MATVLITGASRGLGLEFCKQYAAEGWQVLACCRNPAIQSIIKIQQNGSLYFYFGRTPFSPLKLESAEFQLSSGLDRS